MYTLQSNNIWNLVICMLDLLGAFVIAGLMVETTTRTSITEAVREGGDKLWYLIKRLIYSCVAIALFAKSVLVVKGEIRFDAANGIVWLTLLFAIIIYPALKAFRVVEGEDHWRGIRRD